MLEAKPVSASRSEYSEFALPNDANGLGTVLGGKVMHLVDLAGAMAAMRHARKPVVTASVDSLHFLHPVHIGELILGIEVGWVGDHPPAAVARMNIPDVVPMPEDRLGIDLL